MMNFFRRRKIFELNPDNPTYKVSYLGNVATGAARPLKQPFNRVDEILRSLNRLWAAHLMRPTRIGMQLTVCNDGLKVMTEQYGLVEYWAHRITFCGVHPDFPSVFVWIYRHDGKNMKPDLRFHGALCTKPEKAELIAHQLQQKIHQALMEFKREKLSKQRSRLRHESLMQKFGELADLLVYDDANILQHSSSDTSNNMHRFACTDDDGVLQPAATKAGANCTGGSKPVTIKSKHAGTRNCLYDFSPTGENSISHSNHHGTGPSKLSNVGACNMSTSCESWSCTSREYRNSSNQLPFEYSCGIQPKRMDLKSCSKNYRPHASQAGAPKLHSIDEESEFLDDEQRFRKSSAVVVRDSSYSYPTLKAEKSICSRTHSLPKETDEKVAKSDMTSHNTLHHDELHAMRSLPANLRTLIAATDSTAEEADLSDDGVFCKASSSSRESDMQFTGSSTSSSSTASTRTSQSITDEDDDDENSNSSMSVHSYDVDLMPCCTQQVKPNSALIFDSAADCLDGQNLSSSCTTPASASNTLPHTPVPISKQKCCDISAPDAAGVASDIASNRCSSSSSDSTENFEHMEHLSAMLLEKRLGRLALADLESSS